MTEAGKKWITETKQATATTETVRKVSRILVILDENDAGAINNIFINGVTVFNGKIKIAKGDRVDFETTTTEERTGLSLENKCILRIENGVFYKDKGEDS